MEPQIEQGPPGPDQLPKGAATELNDARSQGRQAASQMNQPPLKMQAPDPNQHGPVPVGPDDSGLFGPATAQEQAKYAGPAQMPSSGPPANIGQILPVLIAASKEQDAPPAIKALLGILMQQMGTK